MRTGSALFLRIPSDNRARATTALRNGSAELPFREAPRYLWIALNGEESPLRFAAEILGMWDEIRQNEHGLSFELLIFKVDGGGRGIRTPGALSGTTVFKTAGINRSPIPPRGVGLSSIVRPKVHFAAGQGRHCPGLWPPFGKNLANWSSPVS